MARVVAYKWRVRTRTYGAGVIAGNGGYVRGEIAKTRETGYRWWRGSGYRSGRTEMSSVEAENTPSRAGRRLRDKLVGCNGYG